MRQTLSQIVATIEKFATDHQLIKSFHCSIEKLDSNDWLYPMMVLKIGPATFSMGSILIETSVSFLDMLNDEKTNSVDVESSMLLLMENVFTFFNEMNFHTDGPQFIMEPDFVATPSNLANSDNCIGYSANIKVKTLCSLLQENIPIE